MPRSSSTPLPARWRRGRLIAASTTLLLTALLCWILKPLGLADGLDSWWLSARFTIRERLPAWLQSKPPSDPDIVLALLDDRCTDHWKEPLVAWGSHLADALDRLRISGAKVVALDWIQPESMDRYFPGRDERLQQALQGYTDGNIVLVKELRPDWGEGKFLHTHESLLYAIPTAALDGGERNQGFAEFNQVSSVQTVMQPALPGSIQDVSLAARIAEMWYGKTGKLSAAFWEIPGSIRIPLRENGTILPDYINGSGEDKANKKAFQQVSLYDVSSERMVPDSRFRNKIVLIGTAISGNNDQHFIPFLTGLNPNDLSHIGGNRLANGVEIQANNVRALLRGKVLHEPASPVLWLLCMGLAGGAVFAFLRLSWAKAALTVLLAGTGWVVLSLLLFIGQSLALPVVLPLFSLLLTSGSIGGYLAFTEERERREVMSLWGRYQDPRLVDYLLAYPKARGGEGQEAIVTVLFADLKNFTKTVENLSPPETLRILNRYLAMLESVIRTEYGGLVDKYLGDGLMAQWGAPASPGSAFRADHAEAAVAACKEILRRADELVKDAPGTQDFGLRLTLHTGPVIVGWVGATRIEFTIIGDTVNVTSRLQETAKQLDVEFLISESTYALVKEQVTLGKQAEVEIRGRKQPLRVYEVTDRQ